MPHFSISLIPMCLFPVNRPRACRTATKGEDESDPPKKRGGMRPPIAAPRGVPLSGPMRVALVLIDPCGKARKQPLQKGR